MSSSLTAHADVEDVRVWQSPENTRIVLDMNAPHEHKIFTLLNPNRVVVDIEAAKLTKDLSKVVTENTRVTGFRSGRRGDNDLRIVIDTQAAMDIKSFPLAPNKKYPSHRLVIDLLPEGAEQVTARPVVRNAQDSDAPRDIIIAIDAGHGGEDPGALGPKKIKEKEVVLAISKELEKLLKSTYGYQPYMVRTGDYYIGLRQRTEKARKANADFFVSIHADAFKHPSASGSSVFVLSERGATSETARWLADKENEADLVGGVNIGGRDDHLAMTLLDLSMTHKRNASVQLGSNILAEMGGFTKLHKKQVEEAAFVVLKAPDIPALLVETGFISNPGEAKKLADKKHQKKLARAIFNGITDYFERQPPAGTRIAARQTGQPYRTYVVKSGDTLSGLAVKNNVEMKDLRKLNALNNDSLRIGQKIKLPKS